MARTIETDYSTPLQVGTRADDGRFSPEYLFVRVPLNAVGQPMDKTGLNRDQALHLAQVLIQTVRDLK